MFKRLFRWLLRTIFVLLILFVVVAASEYLSHRYKPGSVLVLQLDGPVVERGEQSPFGLFTQHQTALNLVRQSLQQGERDNRIVGLAIKVIDPQMELAQAQELCAMIREFRSHGKWTTAYIESAGESGLGNLPYLVAASADEVSMMPQGEMNILGVGIREVFARGLLDWIKVTPNFAAIGKYKSAANVFTQKDFTPAQREEDDALAGNMFDQLVAGMANERHLPQDQIRAAINQAPLTADQSLQDKLIDRLEYEDQFDKRVKHYRGEKHELINYDDYARPSLGWFGGGRDKIAIVYGVGAIQRGQGGFDPMLGPASEAMTSDDMIDAFKDAREDDNVRAVVFRVDSPGGSVIASELIRRAVELTAKKKPVVVSMSSYGASGGFWISTPAAKIIADAGTITGSIGVLGGKFNVSGGAEALGIASGAVTRGANAMMFDSFTDFTPAQQQIFRDQILGDTYQYFLKLVAAQRHMTIAQVNDVAQGRVWTGQQALQVKLIDQIGTMTDAIAAAKKLAGISAAAPVRIKELPTETGPLGKLLSGQIAGMAFAEWRVPPEFAPFVRALRMAVERRSMIGEVYCPIVPII